jgi:LAS superfamily LD-carboxypeptidase LdcB
MPNMPGHGLGISVDINIPDQSTYQWLAKHADEYGFVNDVPSKKWHWTYKPRD